MIFEIQLSFLLFSFLKENIYIYIYIYIFISVCILFTKKINVIYNIEVYYERAKWSRCILKRSPHLCPKRRTTWTEGTIYQNWLALKKLNHLINTLTNAVRSRELLVIRTTNIKVSLYDLFIRTNLEHSTSFFGVSK
jgi:hypothetical protein